MHENGHSGIDGGPTNVVIDNVDYFGKDVVPLYKFESSTSPFACGSTGPGRAASLMFLHQGPTLRMSCMVKAQKHKAKVIRCETTKGVHFGENCACCKNVFDWWQDNRPDDPVQLLSPPPRFVADSAVKQQAWLEDQGVCGADVADQIWSEGRWWKRYSSLCRAEIDYFEDTEVPKNISLYPLVSGNAPLAEIEETDEVPPPLGASAGITGWEEVVDYQATVHGSKFSQKVTVYKAVGEPIDEVQVRDARCFPGMAIGLFRYSTNAFLDCVILYDYIEQSHNGKMSIQAFWQRKMLERAAWKRCNKKLPLACDDFPNLQAFTIAVHLFVTQLVRFLFRVYMCLFVCLFGTFERRRKSWPGGMFKPDPVTMV
jgi:hypothetical protein